ncbi:gliding motility protein GldM [Flavobacterium sp. ST-75]|uniref:Gliding motility protein GldM n=1 Tax=Flavobacterium rhizophilum TaxID=3163296 RepID=A0ABW8YID3_9FLAO
MAGGKLTPRQKMINLMYLVFIAMMALNMSKEVLSAFGILNIKIEDSNKLVETNNTDLFTQLSAKAEEQAGYYLTKKEKAEKIRNASNEFYTYVENLKKELTNEYERDLDGNLPYEEMDKGDKLDELFFEGDKPSKKGQEFIDKIKNYNRTVQQIAAQDMLEETKKKLDKRFAIEPVKSKNAGTTLPWLDYNYKGFPLIASITKLTQLENDIRVTENELLSGMFLEGTKKMASLSAFEAIVVPDKTAFFAGEKVTGKIILGKKDPNLKAHSVVVNGQTLGEDAMQAGQTMFEFNAGNIGEQDINGEFQFKEGDSIIKLPIKGNYVVVPKPNSATISADKMNSVYRGVQNPMTISFAGISDNNVKANAQGLSKASKAGQYNWNVNGIQGKTAVVTVTGTLPDGTVVSDKKTFNVRDIPQPSASVRGKTDSAKGNKNDLSNSTINAVFKDFVFDVTTTVKSFEVYVPGNPAIICQGNKFNAQALKAISRASRGDQITINRVQVDVQGAPGYKVRPSSPLVWEVQ